MRSTEKTLIAAVGSIVVLLVLWLFLISPKMKEASELSDQVEATRQEVAAQEALLAQAEAAQAGFDENYSNVIFVGKAVPGEADTPALLTQILDLADEAEVSFQGMTLDVGTGSPTATTTGAQPSADPAAAGEAEAAGSDSAPAADPSAAATPVEATEAAVAGAPIGATVGPAGLPVMPYTLTFNGDFFQIARFFQLLDDLVAYDPVTGLRIDGRLVTIDGFTMAPDQAEGFPQLTVTVQSTTFIAPDGDTTGDSATAAAAAGGAAGDPAAAGSSPSVPVASVGN